MTCECCGSEIVGRAFHFVAPAARVCGRCFDSKMSLLQQCSKMMALGIDTQSDERWPRNMGRERKVADQ